MNFNLIRYQRIESVKYNLKLAKLTEKYENLALTEKQENKLNKQYKSCLKTYIRNSKLLKVINKIMNYLEL